MKKFIVGFFVAVVLLLIIGFVVVGFFLGPMIQTGAQALVPQFAKVDMQIAYADFSPFTGKGEFRGIVVGNPAGFKTPTSITIDTVAVEVEPASLLSDKIQFRSLKVQGPQVTLESSGLKTHNLGKIIENLQAISGGGKGAAAASSSAGSAVSQKLEALTQVGGKKVQVDDFAMTGAKLNLSATALDGNQAGIPLPDINLKGLGAGPGGIASVELVEQILQMVSSHAASASADALMKAAKGAAGAGAGGIGSAAKGLLDSVKK